jgi:putative DeoR family transcriptional regulator (stage III sporulation protein D)
MIHVIEESRPEALGRYIVSYQATVRDAATKFQISKSTVHKDVTSVLKNVNRGLYEEVGAILQKNKSERHLRGGEATRKKYEGKQKK